MHRQVQDLYLVEFITHFFFCWINHEGILLPEYQSGRFYKAQ